MKTLLIFILLLWVKPPKSFSQVTDSADIYDRVEKKYQYYTLEYTSSKNESWAKNVMTKTFENQGMYNSTYIAINNDSTFVFLSIYEPGEFLAVGNWTKINDTTYRFTWDKKKTLNICRNQSQSNKYYRCSFPLPMKISSWIFIKRKGKLLPTVKQEKMKRNHKQQFADQDK